MRKYDEENSACLPSHPVRGAWIEILGKLILIADYLSHPVRGAWIEMFFCSKKAEREARRTPSGVRGLKYQLI